MSKDVIVIKGSVNLVNRTVMVSQKGGSKKKKKVKSKLKVVK